MNTIFNNALWPWDHAQGTVSRALAGRRARRHPSVRRVADRGAPDRTELARLIDGPRRRKKMVHPDFAHAAIGSARFGLWFISAVGRPPAVASSRRAACSCHRRRCSIETMAKNRGRTRKGSPRATIADVSARSAMASHRIFPEFLSPSAINLCAPAAPRFLDAACTIFAKRRILYGGESRKSCCAPVSPAIRPCPDGSRQVFGKHLPAALRQQPGSRQANPPEQSMLFTSEPLLTNPCSAKARMPACCPRPSTPVDKRLETPKPSNFVQDRPTRKTPFMAGNCNPPLVASS